MISNANIHKAILNKLRSKYPSTKIITADTTEGIIRPSFLMQIYNKKSSNVMRSISDRETSVKIQYFSNDANENYLDNLSTEDELLELLLGSKICIQEGESIKIEEVKFYVVDKVLHCEFEVNFTESYFEEDDSEVNENIEISLQLNN